MKVKIEKENKSVKNPYEYNGETLNIPTDLPTSNQGSIDTQTTDTEGITSKTPHTKKV